MSCCANVHPHSHLSPGKATTWRMFCPGHRRIVGFILSKEQMLVCPVCGWSIPYDQTT